jgi:hypothetical protein
MDKAKYGYLAGIIDGEGCITVGRGIRENGVINYNSIVMVTNTNKAVIEWLHEQFGGMYYGSKPNNLVSKPSYRWRLLKKKDIELLLLAIIPYLIIKKEQAKVLLEFVRLPRNDDVQKRQELCNKIQALNKRGISVETNMQDTAKAVKIESELTRDSKNDLTVM